MADNLDSQSTQFVVLSIAQCLTRCHNDTLTCMDAKRVEVLHVADGDTVVVAVAHHFIFYLFPSLERLLYQYLWREGEGFLCLCFQFLVVVAEA